MRVSATLETHVHRRAFLVARVAERVEPHEVDTVRAMVKSEMESVARLEVPLVVDVGVGDNWRDAK